MLINIYMTSIYEVSNHIMRGGRRAVIRAKKSKHGILSGFAMRKRDVTMPFWRQGSSDIYIRINRMVAQGILYPFVGDDGEEYLLLLDKWIEKMKRDGHKNFLEYVDWKKLGRSPRLPPLP